MSKLTIDEMRAQIRALERDVAADTIDATEAFVNLITAPEVAQVIAAIVNAAAPLDDIMRDRAVRLSTMRENMATLAVLELKKMRALVNEGSAAVPSIEGDASA